MLTKSQVNSQTTLTQKNRVTTYINNLGDTMVSMSYRDARILLEDVLVCKYTDSMLTVYQERDSLNTKNNTLYQEVLTKTNQEKTNLQTIVTNLETVVTNKDTELGLNNQTINELKRELRRQKTFKFLGLGGTIVLSVITLLLIR